AEALGGAPQELPATRGEGGAPAGGSGPMDRPVARRGVEQPQRDAFEGDVVTPGAVAIEMAEAIQERLDTCACIEFEPYRRMAQPLLEVAVVDIPCAEQKIEVVLRRARGVRTVAEDRTRPPGGPGPGTEAGVGPRASSEIGRPPRAAPAASRSTPPGEVSARAHVANHTSTLSARIGSLVNVFGEGSVTNTPSSFRPCAPS